MIVFENDDYGYLNWIEDNPGGYVVNLTSGLIKLHTASCGMIKTNKRKNYTSNGQIKHCFSNRREVEEANRIEYHENMTLCKGCKPFRNVSTIPTKHTNS